MRIACAQTVDTRILTQTNNLIRFRVYIQPTIEYTAISSCRRNHNIARSFPDQISFATCVLSPISQCLLNSFIL